MRILETEIIDHNQGNKVIATVWVDGSNTVQSDNPDFLENLRNTDVDGYTIDYGASFVDKLPKLFRGSYIAARRKDSKQEKKK